MHETLNKQPVIAAKNLWKRFYGTPVLKGVDLTVAEGEVAFLIGPSGSGKSTLLRCVNQLETIDGGSLEINGRNVGPYQEGGKWFLPDETRLREQRSGIGMVFQRFNLFPHLTVLENVTVAQRTVLGRPQSEAVEKAKEHLHRVGMANKLGSYPSELSGGQQQRVAISRALAMDPQIMLFDEPTSALDPELVSEVLAVIETLAESKMTLVVVTHEIGFAREAGDTVHMLADGQIVESGKPADMLSEPQSARTRDFLSKVLR